MPYRRLLQYCCLLAGLLLGACVAAVFADEPAPTVPATPTPTPAPVMPAYTPPEYHTVLDGKASLRVLVASKKTMLAWKSDGEVTVTTLPDNTKLYTTKAGEQVGLVRDTATASCFLRQDGKNFCAVPAPLRLDSVKSIQLWNPGGWATYPAPLIITPTTAGAFSVAREMPLDEYVRNVVPAEMPSTSQQQALRAQAVIARSYALTKLGRHADEGADLCNSVHCQVFGADTKRSGTTDEAVNATRGLVLLYGDKLAETYFHSSCGGVTDDAGDIWGPEYARPYLQGVSDLATTTDTKDIKNILDATDAYCKQAGSGRWTKQFTAAEVDALVSKNLPLVTGDPTAKINKVTNLSIDERTANGRVALFRVEGDGASMVVRGDQVRWLFGNGSPGPEGLYSTLFDLTITRDTAGVITGYQFRGAGRGHGLGLCQWGADGRARAGKSFREILRTYYPGTRLSDEK